MVNLKKMLKCIQKRKEKHTIFWPNFTKRCYKRFYKNTIFNFFNQTIINPVARMNIFDKSEPYLPLEKTPKDCSKL